MVLPGMVGCIQICRFRAWKMVKRGPVPLPGSPLAPLLAESASGKRR